MDFEANELRIKVDSGLTLAVKQWGDPEGPAILALHGWLDNAASYTKLAQGLEGYRFLALDFVGHGYSDHRVTGQRYHMVDHVDDVLAVADSLSLDQFVLIGHSMGAGIATLTAGSFPERVSRLVLLEGVGLHTSDESRAPEILRKAVLDLSAAGMKQKPIYETIDGAVQMRMKALGGISHEAASLLCERGLVPVAGGFTWRSDPRLRMSSAIRFSEDMMLAFLAVINAPTLVIMGEQSFLSSDDRMKQRAKLLGAEYLVYPGNHHLHLEPDTCNQVVQAVSAFLEQ